MSEEPKKIVYTLDNGVISRTDKAGQTEVVAQIKDGVIEYASEEALKLRPAVVRFLNDEGVKVPDTIAIKGVARDKPTAGDNIPPKPKMDPQFGDKTPAVVEWYRKYKPEEFKVRYGIKGMGTVIKTETRTDPVTGRSKKFRSQHEALLSTRKIHLTEKLEANSEENEE